MSPLSRMAQLLHSPGVMVRGVTPGQGDQCSAQWVVGRTKLLCCSELRSQDGAALGWPDT